MMSDPNSKRKVTYRLYQTPRQSELLSALLRHHQQLYNAALEERISAWQKAGKSISYAHQCSSLTQLRHELPEWAEANCSSQQTTLRRLDKACQAFFRRVKRGEKPGFPRFKSLSRFPGFSFKSHGDGWKFTPGDKWKHGTLRMSAVGHVACRGNARQGGRICASDILYRDGEWFLSLTVEPTAIVRGRVAHNATALDWGVETLLSCVDESGGTTEIENPRWYQSSKDLIAALQQSVARKKRGSNRRQIAARRLRKAQGKQARRRLDHLHKETNSIARQNALVAMEDLTVKNMTRS